MEYWNIGIVECLNVAPPIYWGRKGQFRRQ
jgi:hypothetical protein